MKRAYQTLDVFTDVPFAGNPLAVVLDADDLDPAAMQAIAREFNLSETVFVLEPRDPVNSARIRIFTPTRELPFAGHPTVGTAALIAQIRAPEMIGRQDLSVVLEEAVGPVTCTVRRQRGIVRASFSLPRLPEVSGEPPAIAVIAAALGLSEADIGFEAHRPCVASAGVPFTFVPLAGLDACARATPGIGLNAIGPVLLYTGESSQPGSAIHARMFAPGLGVTEDPATGAAAAALAGVLVYFERFDDGDHTLVIEQGFEMGRPSLITLGLDIVEGRLASASIGGGTVMVSAGHLSC